MLLITDDDVLTAMDATDEPVELMLRFLRMYSTDEFLGSALDLIVGKHAPYAALIRQINCQPVRRAQLAALYAMLGPIYIAKDNQLPVVKGDTLYLVFRTFEQSRNKNPLELLNDFIQQFDLHCSWQANVVRELDHIPRLEDRVNVMLIASAFLRSLREAIDCKPYADSKWVSDFLSGASR